MCVCVCGWGIIYSTVFTELIHYVYNDLLMKRLWPKISFAITVWMLLLVLLCPKHTGHREMKH